jgi:hypothetical protein
MKYVVLAYPYVFKSGHEREQEDVMKALEDFDEHWERAVFKPDRHPYYRLKLLMHYLKRHKVPFLYLRGLEAESEAKAREFAISALRDALPSVAEATEEYKVEVLPYVEEVVLDPPEEPGAPWGPLALAALAALVAVGWLAALAQR